MLATIVKWVSMAALLMTAMFWNTAPDYQLLLAFVVCMGAIVVFHQAVRAREYPWATVFLVVAVLFNPIVLVLKPSGTFSRLMVLVCVALFAISLAAVKKQPLLFIPSITGRNP